MCTSPGATERIAAHAKDNAAVKKKAATLAWIGLTPRQDSGGGKARPVGVSVTDTERGGLASWRFGASLPPSRSQLPCQRLSHQLCL